MAQEQQFTGLLGEFGLETEEQALARRTRNMIRGSQTQIASAGFTDPNQRIVANIGAGIGALLGSKLTKGSALPDDEKQRTKIVEDANAKFRDFSNKSENFAEMLPEEKALKYQQFLATSAVKNGNPSLAAQISQSAATKEIAFRKSRQEIKKLDQEIKTDELTFEILGEDRKRSLAGEFGTFVAPGPDGVFDVMDLEANSITGRVNENGVLQITNEDGTISEARQFLTMEEALKMRDDLVDMLGTDGSASHEDRLKMFNKFFTSSQRGKMQETMRALRQQLNIMDDVAVNFKGFLDQGRDPSAFLDGTGRIVDFTSNLKSSIVGINEAFVKPITRGLGDNAEVLAAGPADILSSGEFDNEIAGIKLPPDLAETGAVAAEYRAAIVELAYAVARANEPGARQLSDQDFRLALQQIGASAADPEKMRRVILANLTRRADSFNIDQQMVAGIAEAVGLERDKGLELVFGGTLGEFQARQRQTMQTYQDLAQDISNFRQGRAAERAGITSLPEVDEAPSESLDGNLTPEEEQALAEEILQGL